MEQRPAPIVAGLGGAALVAAVMSIGGHSSQPGTEKQSADTAVTDKYTTTAAAFTANQEGPWYAFCQEYATIEFDHGEDPPKSGASVAITFLEKPMRALSRSPAI